MPARKRAVSSGGGNEDCVDGGEPRSATCSVRGDRAKSESARTATAREVTKIVVILFIQREQTFYLRLNREPGRQTWWRGRTMIQLGESTRGRSSSKQSPRRR